jgi:hypothetical protein
VAQAKARILRLSWFHPSRKRRCPFLSLHRFFPWVIDCTVKGLNRRGGKRKSFAWEQYSQVLGRVKRARPRITEAKRRRVGA